MDFIERREQRSQTGTKVVYLLKSKPDYKRKRMEAAKRAAVTRKENNLVPFYDNGIVAPVKKQHNPLELAALMLGNRLREKPAGYFLDGLPASLTQIMRATNSVLIQRGLEQITVNPQWVIENT